MNIPTEIAIFVRSLVEGSKIGYTRGGEYRSGTVNAISKEADGNSWVVTFVEDGCLYIPTLVGSKIVAARTGPAPTFNAYGNRRQVVTLACGDNRTLDTWFDDERGPWINNPVGLTWAEAEDRARSLAIADIKLWR